MPSITVPSLAILDATKVQAADALYVQRLREYTPQVEVRAGMLHDLVVRLAAVLYAAAQHTIDLDQQSSSLLALTANPELADPAFVDQLMSNYGLTRNPGAAATGSIAVVLSQAAPTVIAQGSVFTAQGRTFTATATFTARTTTSGPNDRLLTQLDDGRWLFTVDVTDSASGAAGNLPLNTAMTPATPPQFLVRAYAAADFTGGTDADTNTTLLAQLKTGVAAKDTSNRATLAGLVAADGRFPATQISAVGYGDAEQQRYHSILPVAFGGRVDVYARTQAVPGTVRLTKTATLVDGTGGVGTWQFGVGRTDAPGFYEVQSVVPAAADPASRSGYLVTELLRSADTTGLERPPDIQTPLEAAFTPFQAAVVRFIDTDTPLTGLLVGSSTKSYDVYLTTMPLLKELQDLLAGDNVRALGSDLLVRAAVPCFVSLAVTVQQASGAAAVDAAAVAAAACAAVNSTGFTAVLPAGPIAAAVQAALPAGQTVTAVTLSGRLLRPNDTTALLSSTTGLTVPSSAGQLTTARTVVFTTTPDRVSVLAVS